MLLGRGVVQILGPGPFSVTSMTHVTSKIPCDNNFLCHRIVRSEGHEPVPFAFPGSQHRDVMCFREFSHSHHDHRHFDCRSSNSRSSSSPERKTKMPVDKAYHQGVYHVDTFYCGSGQGYFQVLQIWVTTSRRLKQGRVVG